MASTRNNMPAAVVAGSQEQCNSLAKNEDAAAPIAATMTAKTTKSRTIHAEKALPGAAPVAVDSNTSMTYRRSDLQTSSVSVDLRNRLHIGRNENDYAPVNSTTTVQSNGHSVGNKSTNTDVIAPSSPRLTAAPSEVNADDVDGVCSIANHPTTPLTHASISYAIYQNELQMPDIMRLIQKDLSEPYSIYTYRYFIHNWPKLCFLAMHGPLCVGAIVCKLDIHRQAIKRGYIAMLAVDKNYRKLKIGTNLVQNAIKAMLSYNADEVVLETEITNTPALRLYENLGFVRDKRLFGYYLNGVDALRLKLWFR